MRRPLGMLSLPLDPLRPRRAEAARALGLAGALLCAAATAAAEGPAQEAASFTLSERPSDLVLRFAESFGELQTDERGPSLEIYGDGRALVRRPAFMKAPGEHELRLSRAELRSLVRSLVARGVADFDAGATRARLRELDAADRSLSFRSDVSLIEIELHLERYRAAGSAAPETSRVRRIRWRGLRGDARRRPELAALRDLDAACGELRALTRRPLQGGP